MKLFNQIKKTLNSTKTSFKRFPFSTISIWLSAVCFIMAVDIESSTNIDIVTLKSTKYGFLFLIASVSIVALRVFVESLSGSIQSEDDIGKYRLYKIFGYIINILILYGIYDRILFSEKELFLYDNRTAYFGLFIFFIISCFFIAKLFYHKDYVVYVISIIRSLMISFSYSIILYMGVSAIYYAIEHLFEIDIINYFYIKAAILIFLVFNFMVFLSDFPKYSKTFDSYTVPKVIKVLFTYILVPIFSIYAIILYMYFLKVIVLNEIPRNLVANLVLWYGLFSVCLLFFIKEIKNSKIVDKFRTIFPYAIIPLLLMLFYSIILRIREYGFTEHRYFVLVGGIYILLAMLYYIFYKNNSNITIPIILNIIIMVSAIGPLSAYNVSVRSQNSILKNVLLKNNMINGNEILKKQDLPQADKIKIAETVKYMTDNYRSYEIKNLPVDFVFDNKKFEELFGFKPDDSFSGSPYNNYSFEKSGPIKVDGYEEMMFFDVYSNSDDLIIGTYKLSKFEDGIISIYSVDSSKEDEILSFKASDIFDKLKAIRNAKGQVDIEDLSIEGSNKGVKYKILFTNMYDYSRGSNNMDFEISFYLLIGKN